MSRIGLWTLFKGKSKICLFSLCKHYIMLFLTGVDNTYNFFLLFCYYRRFSHLLPCFFIKILVSRRALR